MRPIKPSPFTPGDTVALTVQFLRNTGQFAGGDAVSQWTVVGCDCPLCRTGRFVATNEPSQYPDGESWPGDSPRHINAGNLYRVGTVDSRNA